VNGDLGGMTLSSDAPRNTIESARDCLAHFHASEPHLVELGAQSDHAAAAAGLAAIGYSGWVAVEQRAVTKDKARSAKGAAVERAVKFAKAAYAAASE